VRKFRRKGPWKSPGEAFGREDGEGERKFESNKISLAELT
jgi:hypothetical protein